MKRLFTLLLATMLFVGVVVFVAPKALAATTVTVTDSAGVNMREGPGTSYNKVISIPVNTVLTVTETQSADGYTWGKVTYDGKTGWIALDFTDYDPNQTPPAPPSSNGKWEQSGGKWYYYIDGVMQTGWHCDGGKWYYMDASGVMQTGWLNLSGKWYFLNGSGVMQTGWLKQGSTTYYLDANGIMQTGWQRIGGYQYYFKSGGAMQTGWLEYDGFWYYLKANGAMAVGKAMIDGQANKFDTNGKWLGLAKYMTSQACVDMIKQYEGFSAKPYWDVVQWTVGYGTRCPDDKKDYYDQYGISTEEAEILLRDFIISFEESVDAFIESYGLNLTPSQYDALISFSYNCGAGWTTEYSGTFHNAIKNGATGSELIRAFGLWCSAGGEVLPGLIDRRKSEANMYLNGEYSQTIPSNFCHVYFNVNGGEKVPRVQCYDSNEQPAPAETPTHETKYFAGWYTAQTGGSKVTKLTKAHDGTTLYAHWSDTPVDPGASDPTPPANATNLVTVTGDVLNVRSGPGTGYSKVAELTRGTQVAILELKTVDGYTWGRYSAGWIRLDYTDYNPASFQIPGRWLQESGKWYYIQDGKRVKSWNRIDGSWYYFDSNSVMKTGWIKDGKDWYYLDASGRMKTGWVLLGTTWYYMNGSGVMQTGWLQEGSKTYYLGSSGAMVRGLYTVDNDRYYFNGSGVMQTGLQQIDGKQYLFASNGKMQTGWQEIDGVQYYFTADGYMASGWQEIDGKRYYFSDGLICTGWQRINGIWYYMNSDGIMQTGWQRIGGTWYYLKSNGQMATGWVKNGGKWYYLNAGGAMQTGWLQLGSNWYYLKSSGEMVTGSYTIGPVTYQFDSNGVWIG